MRRLKHKQHVFISFRSKKTNGGLMDDSVVFE